MGRGRDRLSALAVSRLSRPGLHADGGGLYLRVVKGSSSRTFVWRFRSNGKRRVMGLGPVQDMSLIEARELARELRRKVRAGIDPIEERARQRAPTQASVTPIVTFKMAAEDYLERNAPAWKNGKHGDQWRTTLQRYAYPHIGDKSVAAIETADVLAVVEPVWATRTETATRLRGRIELILNAAAVRGHRSVENPARWRGHLENLLPRRSKVRKVRHHAALAYGELPAFVARLSQQNGTAAQALLFTIFTAARTSEVLGAVWKEIDLAAGIWTVPADRIKAGREHRVPLAEGALALLRARAATGDTGPHDFVFQSKPKPVALSSNAMLMLLRRLEREDLTVHGFRSTFRDWVSEMTDFSREVAEMALAHAIGDKVEAAYRRGDLFGKRRDLMVAWDAFARSSSINRQLVIASDAA